MTGNGAMPFDPWASMRARLIDWASSGKPRRVIGALPLG